jgi:Do/DeqQ family serine protease
MQYAAGQKNNFLILLRTGFVMVLWLVCVVQNSAIAAEAQAWPQNRAQMAMSFAPLVKRTAPAVVNIYTSKLVEQRVLPLFMNDPLFQEFFGVPPAGMTRERMENSLGSGVILRQDGLVVTSAHVIQGADEIKVVLSDRQEFSAKILTVDRKTDLAVLRLQDIKTKLPALELADSDTAEVGDLVLAIGNPFGVGQTVTSGIVSALARSGVEINDLNYFIQTDAAINPGNSGGALVDMDGRLLGINAAIFSRSGGSLGIGFAVPATMVRAVLESVEQGHKRIIRPWLGVSGQDVTAELAAGLGLTRPSGVLVTKLAAASPLAGAGLRNGDVIQGLNDKDIPDQAALRFRLATLAVGGSAKLTISRNGQRQELEFPLIAPPEVPARQETILRGRHALAGLRVANLSPAVADELDMEDAATGVVVLGGRIQAFGLNLSTGDRIVAINRVPIASVNDLQAALQQITRRWLLQIDRRGQMLTFVIGE